MFDRLTPSQIRLLIFVACIVLASVGGYVLRRLGLVRRAHAKYVMSAAIIGCDAPIAWLALWHLEIKRGAWLVPVAGAIVAVAIVLVGLGLARLGRMNPRDQGVFGLQSGMGNVGYTLGGSLALAVWGLQGIALEQMFCIMWPFFAFLFCFPVGRHYAERAAIASGRMEKPPEEPGVLHYGLGLMLRSLTDLRSLPLYLAVLGLSLNLSDVEPLPEIENWHVIDVLMVLGILMQFGGVGMTVRFRKLPKFWKPALGVAGLKLVASPLLMLGVAWLMGLEGMELGVVLLLAAMPTALYSVLIANVFDLDKDLANATFILTHAICLTTLVPVLFLFVI